MRLGWVEITWVGTKRQQVLRRYHETKSRIECIRYCRQKWGWSLMQSKQYVWNLIPDDVYLPKIEF